LGILASLGYHRLRVFTRPRIALITTGDEIKEPEETVAPHQIRNSNRYVLEALLGQMHLTCHSFKAADSPQAITEILEQVAHYELIILTGGVSMGEADFVPAVLSNFGVEKILHKTAIKPGKPMWVGKSKNGLVFGLPGNPLSCQITFKLFIEPYLRAATAQPKLTPMLLPLAHERAKKSDLDEFFPCYFTPEGQVASASFNGSGDITAALHTQGFARHPKDEPIIEVATKVEFWFW
jgi:molybdopterin molybdotransferase